MFEIIKTKEDLMRKIDVDLKFLVVGGTTRERTLEDISERIGWYVKQLVADIGINFNTDMINIINERIVK